MQAKDLLTLGTPRAIDSPPLIRTVDDVYLLEIRLYVSPDLHRGACFIEIANADSGDPIFWEMLPGAADDDEILGLLPQAFVTTQGRLAELLEPF